MLLLLLRQPAMARGRSRCNRGRPEMRLEVIHRHRLKSATDVDDEVLGAGYLLLVWSAVNGRQVWQEWRRRHMHKGGRPQGPWRRWRRKRAA